MPYISDMELPPQITKNFHWLPIIIMAALNEMTQRANVLSRGF
jgi:hypothetical protein